jgi:hypothetical protein
MRRGLRIHIRRMHQAYIDAVPTLPEPTEDDLEFFTNIMRLSIFSHLPAHRSNIGLTSYKLHGIREGVFVKTFLTCGLIYNAKGRHYKCVFRGIDGLKRFTDALGIQGDLEREDASGSVAYVKVAAQGESDREVKVEWRERKSRYKRPEHAGLPVEGLTQVCTVTFTLERR